MATKEVGMTYTQAAVGLLPVPGRTVTYCTLSASVVIHYSSPFPVCF
jgi:hypothetical protein